MAKTKTKVVRNLSLRDRFMRHVEVEENGCWAWTSVKASCGRGLFRMASTPKPRWLKAHLAAKVIFHNEVRPEGYEGHHTCLNNKCVNPDHVKLLTISEHRAEHRRLKELTQA